MGLGIRAMTLIPRVTVLVDGSLPQTRAADVFIYNIERDEGGDGMDRGKHTHTNAKALVKI